MSGAVHYLEQHFFTFHEPGQIPLLILLSSSNSTQEQSHIIVSSAWSRAWLS